MRERKRVRERAKERKSDGSREEERGKDRGLERTAPVCLLLFVCGVPARCAGMGIITKP